MSRLYFECHVSLSAGKSDAVIHIGRSFGFWLSIIAHDDGDDLKGGRLLTSRDEDFPRMKARMVALMNRLKDKGAFITRYKIERAVVDSKEDDRIWSLETRNYGAPQDACPHLADGVPCELHPGHGGKCR